jgi:hypothetical protein
VALRQVFSEDFSFPYQFLFHRLLHIHHHLSIGAGTTGQLVADVPSGLSLTPPQKKLKKTTFYSSIHPSVHPSMHPCNHLFTYGSTVFLLDLGRFFSFLILYTVGRTPCTGYQPVAMPLPMHRTTPRINEHNTDIPALSGIGTDDPSGRASEDISCLRPRGHCDRRLYVTKLNIPNGKWCIVA